MCAYTSRMHACICTWRQRYIHYMPMRAIARIFTHWMHPESPTPWPPTAWSLPEMPVAASGLFAVRWCLGTSWHAAWGMMCFDCAAPRPSEPPREHTCGLSFRWCQVGPSWQGFRSSSQTMPPNCQSHGGSHLWTLVVHWTSESLHWISNSRTFFTTSIASIDHKVQAVLHCFIRCVVLCHCLAKDRLDA